MLCYCRQHSHSTWNSCSTFHDHGWITRLVSFVLNLVDSLSSRSYLNSSASFFLYHLLRIGFLKIKLKYLTQSSFFQLVLLVNFLNVLKKIWQKLQKTFSNISKLIQQQLKAMFRILEGDRFEWSEVKSVNGF